MPPTASTFEVPEPTRIIVSGIDKETGRPDCRRHPDGAPARALQGQGHPVRRRARAPQGRQGRSGTDERFTHPGAAAAALPGSQEGHTAPRSAPVWRCSAATGTSPPRSSTTSQAAPWPPPRRRKQPCVARRSRSRPQPRSASWWPAAPRTPGSQKSSSTGAGSRTTAGSRLWPTSAREEGLKF